MGFNLEFEVKDNLTDSQKKQLRDQFLKHFKKEEEDLSALRGFYLVNPLDDTISYKLMQAHSSTSLLIEGK